MSSFPLLLYFVFLFLMGMTDSSFLLPAKTHKNKDKYRDDDSPNSNPKP